MKRKVLTVTVFFILIITILTVIFISKINSYSDQELLRQQLVRLSEIKRISQSIADETDNEDASELTDAIDQYESIQQDIINNYENTAAKRFVLTIYISCVLFIAVIFGYIYFAMLRPFDKMRAFAGKIADGNFDIPLRYERSNYFGAFTWAFDNMRKEIIRARSSEKEAIINNKTVIATISHDIKTPIASIRAYSEGLIANLDGSTEKREKYASVIIKKCEEVVNLTNDLFLHSVSDLDKLKIEIKPVNIKRLLESSVDQSSGGIYSVHLTGNIPDCVVMLDSQRFEQVIENLIGNSLKYAGTDIDISSKIIDNDYVITVRDYGSGIPDEDMPFIFGKFFRGKNAGDNPGSGLGLYITKYIMDKHNGSIMLFNHSEGLEAVLSFPVSTQ